MTQQKKIFKLVEKKAAMTLAWIATIMILMVPPSLCRSTGQSIPEPLFKF